MIDAKPVPRYISLRQAAARPHGLMHLAAKQRHKLYQNKCYQRHIRELYSQFEGHDILPSLDGATIERISNRKAKKLILKYEWLQTMGTGTKACYGLKLNEELIGVACFGTGGSIQARNICGPEYIDQTMCLMRGACVPHAPKNAGSFLVRYACKQAFNDYGWAIFFAYSDANAGEIGTVYQAANWHYIGAAKQGAKTFFMSPDDKERISSYGFSKKNEPRFYALGWDGKTPKYDFLRSRGWTEGQDSIKNKWVWFDGPAKEKLRSCCRFKFLPYPKRNTA